MLFPLVRDIRSLSPKNQDVIVRGWVRTKREMKNLVFIEVNDGSSLTGIQCVFDRDGGENAGAGAKAGNTAGTLAALGTGASVEIRGRLVPSPAAGQDVEVAASEIAVLGPAPAESYPLQKKHHSLEFLREIAHLRARTNTFGAVARVRSNLAFAVHRFFRERGFLYLHTPVITSNDAEGAGAMFRVTTLDPSVKPESGYGGDFFGRAAYLTVSGQLEAETYACALSRVYTFGPAFRAENSNTVRHLAEFWMIEPEMAFASLEDDMDLAEDFLKCLFTAALEDCAEDIAFFSKHFSGEHAGKGIAGTLEEAAASRFVRMTYTEAVRELEKAADSFEYRPRWGCDLQSEHEKFLTEKVAGGPVIVTSYPKEIKAFYMKMNDDEKTVRAMDVLVPRLGEIIGGSQREDDPLKLSRRMEELGMKTDNYFWYLDLRRYGSVPHSGFGLGFERLIQYVTGMINIRDVIPYPRAAGQAEF
ncbi:MAG: asparagine--tRNA ligase [Treponema sp.]|jgi:asparaginyl-tRNA synthetase|nr:asparagine--tRNA ligase [Treponema sp.]